MVDSGAGWFEQDVGGGCRVILQEGGRVRGGFGDAGRWGGVMAGAGREGAAFGGGRGGGLHMGRVSWPKSGSGFSTVWKVFDHAPGHGKALALGRGGAPPRCGFFRHSMEKDGATGLHVGQRTPSWG